MGCESTVGVGALLERPSTPETQGDVIGIYPIYGAIHRSFYGLDPIAFVLVVEEDEPIQTTIEYARHPSRWEGEADLIETRVLRAWGEGDDVYLGLRKTRQGYDVLCAVPSNTWASSTHPNRDSFFAKYGFAPRQEGIDEGVRFSGKLKEQSDGSLSFFLDHHEGNSQDRQKQIAYATKYLSRLEDLIIPTNIHSVQHS